MLEYLMTACSDVIACGEVTSARLFDYNARKCSCGRLAKECSVWRLLADTSYAAEAFSHEALDIKLLERVGPRYAAMIDSSKTAWRSAAAPFTLRSALGGDFHLVHIVRDPRAVCWSLLKKKRRTDIRSGERMLLIKMALGWYYANLACEYFCWRFDHQYCRVRYEDVAKDPQAIVRSLLNTVLPSARWAFESIGTQNNRHQLYGNRMRRKSLLIECIKIDNEWRTEMPGQLQKLVGSLSWPLSTRYGYL